MYASFPLGFEGRMWDLIVLSLPFYLLFGRTAVMYGILFSFLCIIISTGACGNFVKNVTAFIHIGIGMPFYLYAWAAT